MYSTRDPYPYPRYDNDEQFMGRKIKYAQRHSKSNEKSSQLNYQEDPWIRLTHEKTLSSSRREVTHYDFAAPQDSLDFALKTEYDQHREFLKSKNETVLQKETLGKTHNRILKNRTIHLGPEEPTLGHPVRVVESQIRENPNSVKSSISSHHTQTTNVGFSRKPDGGYYAS